MLAAVLGQRRFGYYYAVNAALLTGYFSWKMLDIAGLRKLLAKSKEVVGVVKKFKKREKKDRGKAKPKTFMQPRGAWIRVIVVGIVIFFLVFYPNIGKIKALASSQYIMTRGWYSSCLWLKDNSPEPFGDPEFYYELYSPGDEFEYPETAYGVMSWWDYGYFIMQLAHRLPNANPTQARAREAGQFFTAQNETSANMLANEFGSKYVMIDYAMATSKFYAMVEWAGKNVGEFHEAYCVPVSDYALQQVTLWYPGYYNSTVARLYNFDGRAVVPSGNSTVAISWEWRTGEELLKLGYEVIIVSEDRVIRIDRGEGYKVILDGWYFLNYQEAEAYVSSQKSGNYAIGGLNPFATIVPLEELNSYERVYQSKDTITSTTVKIFEYLGPGES
jgi:asparagine N-glycosylation enzyme membrane subunit Stt3